MAPPMAAGDMIVTRGDVGDQRAKDVEGSIVAQTFFQHHIGGDLIERHVSGTLHHDLDLFVPSPLSQLAQGNELLQLGGIGGVGNAAGTAGVAQADGHIVFPENIHDFVVIFIERVFLTGQLHPGEEQGTAAGYDLGLAGIVLEPLGGFAVDAGVDGS